MQWETIVGEPLLQMLRFRHRARAGRGMIGIVAINVVMVLLALGIASGVVPAKIFGGMVDVLHKTIGITMPSREKERTVSVIWIVSMIVIGDGMLFLLVFLTGAVVKTSVSSANSSRCYLRKARAAGSSSHV